jgi:hypothetical protein
MPSMSPTDPILGRARDLKRIEAAFENHRVVQLIGPPGVGKTRLADAARMAQQGPCFDARLADVDDGEAVISVIALVCGVTLREGDPRLHIARALQNVGACLLVLDNLEQLAGRIEPMISGLLQATPALRLLVTSRVELSLPGSARLRVEPLEAEPARQLLLRDADDADPAPAVVERLLTRLDHLPLAIELARSWLAVLTPGELLARLQRDDDIFGSTDSVALERMMTGSWSRLSPAARQTCIHLALLPGGAHLNTLVHIAPEMDGPSALRELVQHQLVRRVPDLYTRSKHRFAPFVPVRAYARRLATDEMRAAVEAGVIEVLTRDPDQLLDWLACASTWQVQLSAIDRPMVEWAWQANASTTSERAFFIGLRLHGSMMVTGPARQHLEMVERLEAIATALGSYRLRGWAAYVAGHARWVWHGAREAIPFFEAAVLLAEQGEDFQLARAALRWSLFCSIESDQRPEREAVRAHIGRLGLPITRAERAEWAQLLAFDLHRQGRRVEALALLRRSLLDATELDSAGLEYLAAQNLVSCSSLRARSRPRSALASGR